MEEYIRDPDEEPLSMTSLQVAEIFGMRHSYILKKLRWMGYQEEERRKHYKDSFYTDTQGRERPMCLMDWFGFTILALSLGRRKPPEFREALVNMLRWGPEYNVKRPTL